MDVKEPPKPRAKEPLIGATKADVENLSELILSLHLGLSVWLHIPEAELTPDEARRLAEASSRVARHYPLLRSQKTVDTLNLMMVAGTIYGPRGVAFYLRLKEHQVPAAIQPQTAPVSPQHPIPPMPTAQPPRFVTPGQMDPASMMASSLTSGSA